MDTDRGTVVVRVDRGVTASTARWVGDIVTRAACRGVPCPAPMTACDPTTAGHADGATVTVRPFVNGVNLDRDEPSQVKAAGAALGRLHDALRDETRDRPSPSPWAATFWPGDLDPPDLHDPALDAWHDAFMADPDPGLSRGVVHGDFWADNLIWEVDHIAAVIDWSEARIDTHARELAWATWEFGHDGRPSPMLQAARARTFLAGYRDVTGPWEPGLHDAFISLMRFELRVNARYSLADKADEQYNAGLRRAFDRLRHQSPVGLLRG